ncbi:MAG: YbaY family lipoprotein [Pirellulaceae bacterium]
MTSRVWRWCVCGCALLSALAGPLGAQDRDRDQGRDRDRGDDGGFEQRDRGDPDRDDPDRDDPDRDDPNRGDPDRGDPDRGDPDRDFPGMPRRESRLAPPRPDREGRWFLGVEVDYQNFGAVITRVTRQSPARRAGLEPRDVIVTVNGYQIGSVNNRLYPLDRELEVRAGRRGNVRLLVQNQRNGTLSNLDIQLERADRPSDPSREAMLIGTVTSRREGQLPREAVLTVRLVDLTDPRAALNPITQQTYRDLGPLPIPFELQYDPGQIAAGRRYVLQASVTVNGLLAFRTRDTYEVFSNNAPRRIDMILESAR